MTLEERLDLWGRGWRGPLLAALLALAAGLPGLIALPPLDRDEARFAQASAQMLESGDFVSPRFQETPRFKKPVGIYWLQAAAVKAFSHVEERAIWAFRIPSLAGAMLAAAACAWGAASFLGSGPALAGGAALGASFMLSTEAAIAAADGVLAGATTLGMAALARLYLSARGGPAAGGRTKLALWCGLALAVLVKGPVAPMVFALTLLGLWLWDRQVAWVGALGWGWGLILVLAVVGPWAMAITVASDGAFWGAAVGGDLTPKLAGGQEGHGAPPGLHVLLLPLLISPATLMLPAAAATGWRFRAEPGVRFALCWLIPAWLVFEAVPTKLPHYTLPLYGALAWLIARSICEPAPPLIRWMGAALALLTAGAFAVAGPLAMSRLGDFSGTPWALLAGALFLAAGLAGGALYLAGRSRSALAAAMGLTVTAHGVLAAGLAPRLAPLWLPSRTSAALARSGADPRDGVTPGPVTVAGYEEPSLVFLLGSDTELGSVADAADAVVEGRPAIVEGREDRAFQDGLRRRGARAGLIAEVSGLDYSNNRRDTLRLYRPSPPEPKAPP